MYGNTPEAAEFREHELLKRAEKAEAERDRYRDAWLLRGQKLNEANAEPDRLREVLYAAWTIIANVSEGDWTKQTDEWVKAAERWRDEDFHPSLDRAGGSP